MTEPQYDNDINFKIISKGKISACFTERNITDFLSAIDYIKQLPYRRKRNKSDLSSVFSEKCGTCSTKHAVLKQLADENKYPYVKLMLGIFRMNSQNTPAVAGILKEAKLEYIPEAHNYLKINNVVFDCTFPSSAALHFLNELMLEQEITAKQIGEFKISFHKSYLKQWLNYHPNIQFSFDHLWMIREKCIKELSNQF